MNKILSGGLLTAMLAVTVFALSAGSAAAAPNGNAWGYWSNPGNSAYGRMHNKHYEYRWGGQSFEDFDDLEAYIRNWLEAWRKRIEEHYGTGGTTADLNVTTRTVTDIDENGATFRGTVAWDDAEYADVWFEYGTKASSLSNSTSKVRLNEDEDDTDFEKAVSGLNDDTVYYVRAVAQDDDGDKDYGIIRSFRTEEDTTDDEEDDEPVAETEAPRNVGETSADLRGSVDMNDFENGVVFFVYGEDEDMVSDVADDYDTYDDIDEDGDSLRKVRVDDDLDDDESYVTNVTGLDDATKHYFAIGVAYEDEDGDDVIKLGSVRTFTTD